jgi:hypothetical protein
MLALLTLLTLLALPALPVTRCVARRTALLSPRGRTGTRIVLERRTPRQGKRANRR